MFYMRKARRFLIGLAALALLAGPSPAWTAALSDPARTLVKPTARSTTITGMAWDADNNTPIPGARVRLRDVQHARIVAAAIANDMGRFTFDNVEPGSYVVELVNDKGKVLGVGPMFNAAPGDTIATFVRLGSHVPGLSGLFGNTAAAIVSSAAGLGITAVSARGRDVSPETPGTTGAR